MSQEEWKTDRKELREKFEMYLQWVWDTWDEAELRGTPFKGIHRILETGLSKDIIMEMYRDTGWLMGVSEAFGWSLNKPGPREWSPRDR